MATPPSDDTLRLFKLLEDNEWHPYHVIKGKIAEKVPPGRAIRRYQDRLKQSRELRQPVNEVIRTEDEQIRLGAMQCAQVVLTSWKGKGIMVRGEGEFKQVRMKPGFKTWGVQDKNPDGGAQDPGKEAQGVPEVPQEDSEPSEAFPEGREEASDPEPVPVAFAEPVKDNIPTFDVEEIFPEAEPAVQAFTPEPATTESEDPSQTVTSFEVSRCSECGMAIIDSDLHDGWHRDLKAVLESPGSAFLDPETLRTLLEGVMRQALARFQAGIQDYLDDRFAEVNHKIVSSAKTREPRSDWY
jgi:hypothetical protein